MPLHALHQLDPTLPLLLSHRRICLRGLHQVSLQSQHLFLEVEEGCLKTEALSTLLPLYALNCSADTDLPFFTGALRL